jgi:hypothetical protein
MSTPLHQHCNAAVADQILTNDIVRLEEQRQLMIHRTDITQIQEDINLLRAELINN